MTLGPLGIHHLDVVIFWLITPYNCDDKCNRILLDKAPGTIVTCLSSTGFADLAPPDPAV
jgi:hypothetical protein